MNRKLKRQIKAYAGVVGAILSAEKLNAQVVYVDVNPDTLVSGQPLNSGLHQFLLDVNNDSIMDFDFRVLSFTASSGFASGYLIKVSPQNGNQIGNRSYFISNYYSSGYFPFPAKLNQGDTLGTDGTWEIGPGQALYSWGCGTHCSGGGVWLPGDDKYLLFQLFQNSNYYYGWLRIEVITHSSFLLKEYAYCTIPNIALRAGFITITSVPGVKAPVPVIFSQNNNIVKINFGEHCKNAVIKVADLTGKKIFHQDFSGSETEVKLSKKGIYFVEVNSEKGIFRKKIFIY